jgi:hypothetical protein
MALAFANRSNKGAAYAFMDKMFNKIGVLVEILIDQGTKF